MAAPATGDRHGKALAEVRSLSMAAVCRGASTIGQPIFSEAAPRKSLTLESPPGILAIRERKSPHRSLESTRVRSRTAPPDPRESRRIHPMNVQAATGSSPAETSKKRILIVDDEAVLTRLMRISLERTGMYEVRTENKSTSVIATAEEFRPDLIMLDLIMPEQDGGDVVEALRKNATLKEVPVVFLTASVKQSDIEAHGGAFDGYPFLSKPASPAMICECIEKHLPR